MILASVPSVLPDSQPGRVHFPSLLVLLATFRNYVHHHLDSVMWKLSDPVIKSLFCEVLRETSILWIKDVILKELIWWDWAVVEAAQRERVM